MDKTQLIDRFSSKPEQRILLSHIYDLMLRRNDRNIITVSEFISEVDCYAVNAFLNACSCQDFMLFGGYDGAERKCAVFLPEYFTPEDVVSTPSLAEMTFVSASVSKFDASSADISHRDVLGSLMGLGIERDSIGDIIADGDRAVFLIKSKLAEFIKNDLTKISRYNVNIELFDNYDITPKIDYTEDSDTVASMRLDAVASSVFSISRTSASDAVSAGLVTVNGTQVSKPDMTVNEGDKLTLRGKGKAVIVKLDGFSKKGRIRFIFRKYK